MPNFSRLGNVLPSKFLSMDLSIEEDSLSTTVIDRTLPMNPKTQLCKLNKRETKTERKSQSYINCDLSIFNLELLRIKENFSFDVIMADPPWRIKG